MNYYDNCLYLLWGYNHKELYADVWKFSLETLLWMKLETNNVFPECAEHKSVSYKHYIIAFGGKGAKNKYDRWKGINQNDIYVLNLIPTNGKYIWRCADAVNKPIGRGKHGMCVYNDFLIVYGGINGESMVLNDIYVAKMKDILSGNQVKWNKMDLDLPTLSLYSHVMVSNGFSIICFGGKTARKFGRNNKLIQFYNIDGETGWNNIGSFICGYLRNIQQTYSFQIPSCLWIDIQKFVGLIYFIKEMDGIESRAGHSGALISPDKLFIFGGFNGTNILNDSHMIQLC